MPARSPSRPARVPRPARALRAARKPSAVALLGVLPRLAVLSGLFVLLAACGSGVSGTPVPGSPVTSGPGTTPGSPTPGTPAPGTTSPPGPARCGMRPMPGTGGTAQPVTGVLTLGNQNNGGTFCVRPGERVMVYLRSTLGRPWAEIRSDSAALAAVPSGLLSLPVGVTGAAFLAARPGTAHVTSDRPVCSSGPVRCDALLAFRVTVVVMASAAAH